MCIIWKMRIAHVVCLGAVVAGGSPGVHAQVPPADLNAIIRQQEQIQRQQEEQRREQERRAKEGAERQTTIPFELPPPPAPGKDGGCIDVLHIEVDGAARLSDDEIEEITGPFLGRCLALSDLNDLMRAFSQAYMDKGYVAARPYLPQQDMRGGVLRLVIVEGKVEAVEPDPQDWAKALEMLFAFPGVIDRPLNLRDIEQGLDQLNRLRSNNASMTLEPGQTQGGTRVVVKNTPGKRWRLSAGTSNGGQESTGRNKVQATGEVDDLLGVNDFLSLTTDRSVVHDDDWRAARSVNGFFSVPFGYWTLSLSASYSDYAAPVFGASQVYRSTGSSKTQKVELERVLHRDSDSKTSASALFRTYTANSYFNDNKIDASSYSLSIGGLGLSHSRRLLGGLLSLRGTWERGLDLVHAEADEAGRAKDSPHAEFDKVTADISYLRPFELGGLSFSYSGTVHGQWTETTLYSPERISLGSQYTVRGFDAEYLTGDVGAYIRNELVLTLPETGQGWIDRGLGRVMPFVALDYGALRGDSRDEMERGAVAGWAAGLRTSGGNVILSAVYSQPLTAPAFIRQRDHEAYLSLTVEY